MCLINMKRHYLWLHNDDSMAETALKKLTRDGNSEGISKPAYTSSVLSWIQNIKACHQGREAGRSLNDGVAEESDAQREDRDSSGDESEPDPAPKKRQEEQDEISTLMAMATDK